MKQFLLTIVLFFTALSPAVKAQTANEGVWVQIEAQPSLTDATARAQSYAARLQDVNGFSLGNGWYAIALGPYSRADATQVLQELRIQGAVPGDSYLAESSSFSAQFFPQGANVLNSVIVSPPVATLSIEGLQPSVGDLLQQEVAPSDETPAEARRSERLLSEAERKGLQTALQWAGFYSSTIDGAFGRGTRASMASWQSANGYDATGILTTEQRIALMRQYNAVLEGLDLQVVRDMAAGIEIALPRAVVSFDTYSAPFAQYTATGDIDATVLLISQQGSRDTLAGLYDIMQSLEIVPLVGPRSRNTNSFTLTGRDASIVSETRVWLQGTDLKGFTLVWPTGDEERRTRLLGEMEASFRRLSGVLDDAAGSETAQSLDLISGLQIRKPRVSRSGFYVDDRGQVVTTREAVQSCTRITLDEEFEAELTAQDEASGAAVLTPIERVAPARIARLSPQEPRLRSEVAVSGFSFEGVLGAPSVTYGTLEDIRGLHGEETLARLSLEHLPGDAGGPVLDAGGNVVGMLLPRPQGSQELPSDVSFALDSDALFEALQRMGVTPRRGTENVGLAPQQISSLGLGMTVLVSCWD